MNKKSYALFIVGICIILAAVVYELWPQPPAPPSVVATSLVNQSTQNPFLPVVITFNQMVKENEITVSVFPNTRTHNVIEGNTIKIIPETTFLPETAYAISLNTSPIYTLRFTTETDVENAPNMNDAVKSANEQYLQKTASQDTSLADIRTHSPVEQQGFVVSYSYTTNTYTVSLRPPQDQNKSVFLSWIKEKGVTDLSTINVIYINR